MPLLRKNTMRRHHMTTNTPDIRSAVAQSYGARVRPVLEADELALPLVDAGACCGSVPAANSCCGPTDSAESACCGEGTSESQVDQVAALYAATDISDLPSTV